MRTNFRVIEEKFKYKLNSAVYNRACIQLPCFVPLPCYGALEIVTGKAYYDSICIRLEYPHQNKILFLLNTSMIQLPSVH